MTFITLNLPELKTIQAMFKRVDFYEMYIKVTGSVPANQETVKIQGKFYKF